MRFCPFCSAENADELAVCQACGRRLPPLPPRRARNAPPTGVQLPPRPINPNTPPPMPRRTGGTVPPPSPVPPLAAPNPPSVSPNSQSGLLPLQPGVMVSPGAMTAPPGSHAAIPAPAPAPRPITTTNPPPIAPMRPGTGPDSSHAQPIRQGTSRDSAPALPPPPAVEDPTTQHRPLPRGPGQISATEAANERSSLLSAISPGPAAQRRDPLPSEPRAPFEGDRRRGDPTGIAAPLGRPKPTTLPPATPTAASTPPPSPPASAPSSPPPSPPPSPPMVVRAKPATLPPPSPSTGAGQFNDDFNTVPSASAYTDDEVVPTKVRSPTGDEPPPTRINRPEALTDRPFTPPKVNAVPEIPEPGLYNAARYAVRFGRARWQRRGAIRTLGAEIKQDTDALDQVLGALGRVARNARVDGRVFSAENAAISTAEERVASLGKEHADVDARKLDENSKFVDVERERNAKLSEAERMVDEAQKELAHLEGQRRAMRDKRKELERRIKAYLKSADDAERSAGSQQMGDARQELRRSAEQHRKEAAALEPDRQEVDRRLASLERPIGESTAKLDAAKAELDAAKRSLSDAREGHTHRLAELDAEQKRKAREITQAESEITRRLVTLGTLVNLNRIDDPQFAELYQRIDRLRGAITARTTEIEKLNAEREAYDRGTLVRGLSAMGGAIVAFIALIVILRAIL